MKRETHFLSRDDWDCLARAIALSPRQKQIARCVLLGQADKQIALSVGIALPTVRTHLRRLFEKLGVEDRVELILYVLRHCRVSYAGGNHDGKH